MTDPTFPLMAFSRHRLGTDGQGVTTLICAWGCPLKCAWCINPACSKADTPVRNVSPGTLYDMAAVDDLYFQATGGGVTFGGGEPLLHAPFIEAFRALCAGRWRLTVETSLFIPPEYVDLAASCVDEFWVDVKDLDPAIYRAYTGRDNAPVIENLKRLLSLVGAARVVVRTPLIPRYNAPDDVARTHESLRKMGVTRLDAFTYIVPEREGRP